jgi:hypothetical protein
LAAGQSWGAGQGAGAVVGIVGIESAMDMLGSWRGGGGALVAEKRSNKDGVEGTSPETGTAKGMGAALAHRWERRLRAKSIHTLGFAADKCGGEGMGWGC